MVPAANFTIVEDVMRHSEFVCLLNTLAVDYRQVQHRGRDTKDMCFRIKVTPDGGDRAAAQFDIPKFKAELFAAELEAAAVLIRAKLHHAPGEVVT